MSNHNRKLLAKFKRKARQKAQMAESRRIAAEIGQVLDHAERIKDIATWYGVPLEALRLPVLTVKP